MKRTRIPSQLMLAGLALLAMLPLSAPSALASDSCPNEQVRAESNINPTTHEPYDMGLAECRAYEMVSPLGKQAHDANVGATGPLVSASGEAAGYASEGAFAGTENYRVTGLTPHNIYVARRGAGGWSTEPAAPPAAVIARPTTDGFNGDASSGEMSTVATCGNVGYTNAQGGSPTFACAMREADDSWLSTPNYTDLNGLTPTTETYYWGASSTLADLVWQPGAFVGLLPGDEIQGGSGALYETAGLGTASPQLRMVSVDDEGTPLTTNHGLDGPYFGGARWFPEVAGSTYQAVSGDGQTVYFTAEPANGGPLTLYARTGDFAGGTPESPVTVEIAHYATYYGASADGSKVFFTTSEELASTDTDSTSDLYEYNFDAAPAHHYVQASRGGLGDTSPGSGANVSQVIGMSSDGSHIYFASDAALTTLPNGDGEHASPVGPNIFGYDTDTDQTQFVATAGVQEGSRANEQQAQVTPDGRFLIFATLAHLSSEDTNSGAAIFRYDFETDALTWISHSAPGFIATDEGDPSTLPGFEEEREGANADFGDARRALSANGEYVTFMTSEKLQADDLGGAPQVYLWHHGTVSLISDGQAPGVTEPPGMSASGSDIVFATATRLVGQDTDNLQDIYDARIDGGFRAPAPERSCAGEACQGGPSAEPVFSTPGTESFTGGGNLTPGPPVVPPPELSKPKTVTSAHRLGNALAACTKDRSKTRRASCKRAARRRYGRAKRTRR